MEWLVLMSITNVLFVNKAKDEKNNDNNNSFGDDNDNDQSDRIRFILRSILGGGP